MESLLQIIKKRPVIFDGAMGTMIQAASAEECNALLNVTRPEIIESIHCAYFDAGADIVSANTFGASFIDLADYGLSNRTEEINAAAIKIARRAAQKFQTEDKPRFVAGEIGPTSKLPTLGHITFKELFESYKQQIAVFIKEGADCVLIATCQDMLQIKAAAAAARETMSKADREIPIIISVTIEKNGTMLLGSDILAALATVLPYRPDAFGINCATGPEMMEEHLHQLSVHSPLPIICRPNAGIPENIGGKPVYPLPPKEFAEKLGSFVERLNVSIAGGCCGTTPLHIKELVSRTTKDARETKDERRRTKYKAQSSLVPRPSSFNSHVSSLFSAVSLDQEPKPFLVAEQTNVNGSKKFKELFLSGDYDAMTAMAKEAARGAHALDVCVASPGRDETKDMAEVVSRFVRAVDAPLMIDSINPVTIEAALQISPGRCIINSINLEDGGAKAKEIIKLAKRYGAALVCLTIDEEGMAKTAPKKAEIAKRLYDLATSSGLRTEDLLFDPLTFTVASGDASLCSAAVETLGGVKKIKKEIKGAKIILGVSNISYGLVPQARKIVTSLFFNAALDAGVDAAIVNPARILRLSQIPKEEAHLATRLLQNDKSKGDPLVAVIKYYQETGGRPFSLQDKSKAGRRGNLRQKIIDGDKSGLEALLEEACKTKKAADVINEILLPAMKEVGELFGKGKLPLPFVLQSAEAMRSSIDLLAPKLKEGEAPRKGTIVLATVRGDVHDIGKNLADIILSNNGYEVVNLGIRQPINAILKAAQEHNANAIGLSGLLVSSTEIMREDLETLKNLGIKTPVLVGGAALTHKFVESTLKSAYGAPVFYCKDAFAGISAMEEIVGK